MRDRADGRIDHELTSNDSLFGARQLAAPRSGRLHLREHRRQRRRRAHQPRHPRPRVEGHDHRQRLDAHLLEHDRQRVARRLQRRRSQPPQPVHRRRGRRSGSASRCPRWPRRCPGFPQFIFAGTNRPSDIRDQRQNTFRDLDQASFSISNNTTWVKGRHSVRFGGIYTRNFAKDGYSTGRERVEGPVQLQRLGHRQRLRRLPARPAQHRARAAQHARRPADGHRLERLGAVRAGRLQAQPAADAVPRPSLRSRRRRSSTRTTSSPTSSSTTAAITSCPTRRSPQLLPPGAHRPGSDASSPTRSASGRGLINTDRNNFSPRVGFAYRIGSDNKTVLRGGFGIFHPTGAAQGARDIMSRNPFRYAITRNRADAAARLHHRHRAARRRDSATRGSTSTSRARTSTSTTSRSSASCRATSACASATSARR